MQQRPPPTLAAPRTREVGSGYKSPTPSTPNSRRYPSPILSRTLPASSQVGPKRAQSAERRRPSTPRSPWSPSSTPVRDSSIDMHLSSRRLSTGSGSPDGLWPSAMRSLSVSFQSDSISFPVSKKEKPPPVNNVSFDRTMRTSSNVAQRQAETPSRSRKSTPERKRSPLKGKNVQDHSENVKPADSLHSRLIDQHRWPSRIGGKVSSNSLNKSLDLTDKAGKASATPVGIGLSSLRRNPISDSVSKPLQKSSSDAAKLSFEEFGKTGPKAHTVDDTISLVSELQKLSTRLSDRMSLITPAARSHPLPTSGSCPSSPSRNSVSRGLSPIRTRPSRGVSPVPTRPSTPSSRGVSPTLTRPSTLPSRGISPVPTRPSTPPSRGVSPSRVRASSGSTQSSSSSVLGFIVDVRKGKMGASYIEEAHYLRLLYNRYLQWRFANDRAEAILFIQAVTAENTLYNVWKATLALWDSVMRKSINLQQLNLELRLNAILNDQMACLDDWALLEEDHLDSFSGAVEDLQASTLHLPVTGGAKTDIESLRVAICSAVDVMQAMGSSICSLLSRVEDKNGLISELAIMAAQERTMLDECEALLASTAAMQMEEYSKNAHLIQVKQAIEKQCPWNLPPWP